jgi:predicted N-acyltransferase
MLSVSPGLCADWDVIAQDAPHTGSSRWLRLAEDRLPGSLTFRYVRDGLTQVAMRGLLLHEPMRNEWLDPQAIASGRGAHLGLASGGPHPWHGRHAADVYPCLTIMYPNYDAFPVGPASAESAALADFVGSLRAWAQDRGARSIAFLYLTPEATTLCGSLRAAGFQFMPLTTRAEMAVTWQDFGGYLAGLPYKRRTSIGREIRALKEAGVSVAIEELSKVEHDLIPLRCLLMRKYRGSADPGREAVWFARVRAAFAPDEITVFTARISGIPVAFSLFVRDGSRWTALLTGMDYSNPAARYSHFATMYYMPAGHAPDIPVQRIFYGIASQDAKRFRGCDLIPLMAAVTP